MTRIESLEQLKARLAGTFSNDEIEALIDRYVETSSVEDHPHMDVIIGLAQRGQEEQLLQVRFRLEDEYYDLLTSYYREEGRPATYLVRKALDEFVEIIS